MEYLALRFIDSTGNIKAVDPSGKVIDIPMGGTSALSNVIRNGLTIFIVVALVLAIIILLWAAIDWLSSGGDKQKVAAARMKVTYAIIGLVVVFLAFFIVNFIGFLFRVPLTG